MSYILEALKRAEAERREREAQAQGRPTHEDWLAGAAPAVAPQPALPRWLWPVLGLLLLGGAAGLWMRRPAETVMPVPPLPPGAQVAQVAPTQASAPRPEGGAAVQPSPVQAAAPAPVPASAPPPTFSTTTASHAPSMKPAAAPTQPPAPSVAPPRPAPEAPAEPVPTSAQAPRLPTLAELPDNLRQQLPPLQTSGAMYSENPADRMLILNNRVMHEGEQVTPELKLEQIRLKSAVLLFRGQRFTLQY